MFCTECGSQIEQGMKFCRNCGARIGGALEPTTPIPTEPGGDLPRRAQPIPAATPRENGGNNRVLVAAAGIAVLVLSGAGIYFATDLFRSKTPSVPEPLAKSTETPPLPSFEETRNAGGSVADSSPLSSNPEPPKPEERPKLPLETLPKADAPSPSGPRIQGGGREPAAERSNRPPSSTPSSRGGVTAGIYETMRTTTVYEDPSASSKVLASIAAGTRVTVVGSNGEWLEVHSRRGNPPGFISRSDAAFIEKSN
jgi:zinc ribbon protein/SH3 domain-containing protein